MSQWGQLMSTWTFKWKGGSRPRFCFKCFAPCCKITKKNLRTFRLHQDFTALLFLRLSASVYFTFTFTFTLLLNSLLSYSQNHEIISTYYEKVGSTQVHFFLDLGSYLCWVFADSPGYCKGDANLLAFCIFFRLNRLFG